MNKENVLYLMMGIPGSGKSTYAKQFASRNKIQYISRDEIRFSLLQPTDGYFDKENEVMKILREKTNLALENGSTLVDSTNLSEKSRARLLNYIKTECAAIVVLFMDTTVSTALKRNALRKKREKAHDIPQTCLSSSCPHRLGNSIRATAIQMWNSPRAGSFF